MKKHGKVLNLLRKTGQNESRQLLNVNTRRGKELKASDRYTPLHNQQQLQTQFRRGQTAFAWPQA